jgi:putative membrane protein
VIPDTAPLGAPTAAPSETSHTAAGRRTALALVGCGILAAVVYGAGLGDVTHHITALGWWAPVVLVPYVIVALADAVAWQVVLPRGPRAPRVPLFRLALVRIAGEAINNVTPTAYLGGEPVKAHLVRRWGVATPDAVASVLVAKTGLIASQILFVVSGLVFLLDRQGHGIGAVGFAALLGLVGFGVVVLMVRVQRRGLVAFVARLAGRVFRRSRYVARLSEQAAEIDARLGAFYGQEARTFLVTTLLHFVGWVLGVWETHLFLALIGTPVSLRDAYIIESLSGTIRGLSVIIPGTIGVQEAGGVVICRLVGIATAPGLALMLLKRAREIVFTLLGLVVLARSRRTR